MSEHRIVFIFIARINQLKNIKLGDEVSYSVWNGIAQEAVNDLGGRFGCEAKAPSFLALGDHVFVDRNDLIVFLVGVFAGNKLIEQIDNGTVDLYQEQFQ